MTNFEFATPPAKAEPQGVSAFADARTTCRARWTADAPISGQADLRLDFSFLPGPSPYDEYGGLGIYCAEADVTQYSTLVVWLSSDAPRLVRLRLASTAYEDVFDNIQPEFGAEYWVGPEPQPLAVDLWSAVYPLWAKFAWSPDQGFPGSDAEALALVLQRFIGLLVSPIPTYDDLGELSAAQEDGYLRIDNIYFR